MAVRSCRERRYAHGRAGKVLRIPIATAGRARRTHVVRALRPRPSLLSADHGLQGGPRRAAHLPPRALHRAFQGPRRHDRRPARHPAVHQARPAPLGSAWGWRDGRGGDGEADGRAHFQEAGFRAEDVRIERFRPLPLDAVLRFFRVCDAAGDGMVAVHCRIGRGRTAAVIALWLMREYRLTARDATVWLRLVRPGTRRPSGLVANIAPRSHVSLALLGRLCAQPGAGGPPLRPGARGAGVGRRAGSRRARLGRPAGGDPGALRSPRPARRRRG